MTPKERASAIAAAVWISTKEKHALEQDIAAAIRAAVEAEREACALIAAETGRTWVEFFDGDGPEACRHIAQAIRERGT